jgi:CubicO group peptidase (beta-lactamase class C family)
MSLDFENTRALIEAGMASGLHIGAVVHVRRRGEILADFAMGRASIHPSAPLSPDQKLLWLSAGKPLTALAIGILQDRGRLRFDDRVCEYIPDFAQNGKEPVTIRHILMQAHAFKPPRTDWPRAPRESVIQAICAAPVIRGAEPGQFAAYDPQSGWYILSEIVARITGTPNHVFVKSELFEPLGCDTASIGLEADEWTAERDAGRLTVLHDTTQSARDRTDLRTDPQVDNLSEIAASPAADVSPQSLPHPWAGDDAQRAAAHNPGGGAVGRASDLAAIYQCLLDGGKAPVGQQILRESTVAEMTSRLRVGLKDHSFGQVVDWGLGFLINSARYGALANPYGYGKHASDATFGHGGMQSSAGLADPENQLVAVIIFNGLPGEPKHQKRINDTLTALYEDL